jgi:type I restriction enzyme S subunit
MSKFNKSSQNDIPNTWSRIPLYEFRNKEDRYGFTGGPFGSDLKSEHYTQSGVKILQLQNIGEGKFIDKGIVYTSEEKANELVSCNIYPGEIILAKMAPVARCCKVPTVDERYVMCSDGIRLSVDTDRFDNEFVFQALNSKYFRDEAESKSTGTTRARIGLNELKQICLLVPNSLPEQQKIAEILSTVDAKIEVIDQQITETQVLKKGLMQQLLTGKLSVIEKRTLSSAEMKDSPLGEIPKSWEIVELSEIAKCTVGIATSTTHAYCEYGVLLLRNQNIKDGKIELKDVLYITPEFDELNKTKRLREDDIITVRTGYPGISAVVPRELEGSQSFTTLIIRRESEIILSKFLCYFINSEKGKTFFQSNQAGGGQQNVGSKTLESMKIIVPTLDEQNQIVEILTSIDDKYEVLSEKKTHYQELKQGLMQQLLTGKIRVNNLMAQI